MILESVKALGKNSQGAAPTRNHHQYVMSQPAELDTLSYSTS